jgi:hypothetical protein
LAGITALIMLSAFVALRVRGIANVIWLAAATAVIYAFVNAVTKSGVDLLTSRGAGVLATWEPYAPMAAGILGGLFGQSAFNAGPLSLSLPVIDTVEPVCSVILAAAVFHEHLARSLGPACVPTRRRCDRGGRDCSSQPFSGRAGGGAPPIPVGQAPANQRSC